MRKSLFILLMLAGVYSTSFAQFDEGQIVVGGAVGFSSSKTTQTSGGTTTDLDPSVNFNFSPRGGYFLSDDLEIGLRVGYNSDRVGDSDNKTVTTSASFGPYVRKYFELGENIAAFGQGAIGIGWGKVKAKGGGTTVKRDDYSSFSVGISPGVMYRLGDRVALEFSVNFLRYSSHTNKGLGATGEDESKTNRFGLGVDLRSLNLGVSIFL